MKHERQNHAPVESAKNSSSVPKRLLIVDDDESFRFLFELALTKMGFEVAAVASGLDALRFFREGRTVDAVLLDYRMPGMNGVETFRNLRAEGVQVPIVLVTAMADIAEVAAREGFNGALPKPCGAEQVANLLQRLSTAAR